MRVLPRSGYVGAESAVTCVAIAWAVTESAHRIAEMSFDGAEPTATGRSSYHPAVLLKLHNLRAPEPGVINRRLKREAGRNGEVMLLLGHPAPDYKTIADVPSFCADVRFLGQNSARSVPSLRVPSAFQTSPCANALALL
jgi:hypothetical protein